MTDSLRSPTTTSKTAFPPKETSTSSSTSYGDVVESGGKVGTDASGADTSSVNHAPGEPYSSGQMPSASAELGELQEEMEFLTRQLQRCEITRAEYESRHREKEAQRESAIASTPYYWTRVLCAHPALGSFITSRDCIALRALRSVRCVRRGVDFDLMFTFDPDANEAFDNKILTKSYRRYEKRGLVIGKDTPRWKEGHDPDGDEDSFFDFFQQPEDPHLLGELLRDEIIPKSVYLFHGGWRPNDAGFDDSDDDTESTVSTNSAAAAAAAHSAATSPLAPGSSSGAGPSSGSTARP